MTFRVLVADPPWLFRDRLPGRKRGAVKHYACLPIDSIQSFTLPPLDDNALLFMWRIASMPQEAIDVVNAWGFVPKSEIVWVKTTVAGDPSSLAFGMGHYVRAAHETCIVAVRGRVKVTSRSVRSVFHAPRGRHSEKPESFFGLVESLSPGPYAELFARRHRPGWSCFGNELDQVA